MAAKPEMIASLVDTKSPSLGEVGTASEWRENRRAGTAMLCPYKRRDARAR